MPGSGMPPMYKPPKVAVTKVPGRGPPNAETIPSIPLGRTVSSTSGAANGYKDSACSDGIAVQNDQRGDGRGTIWIDVGLARVLPDEVHR